MEILVRIRRRRSKGSKDNQFQINQSRFKTNPLLQYCFSLRSKLFSKMDSRSLIKDEKIELNCSSITLKHKLHFSQKKKETKSAHTKKTEKRYTRSHKSYSGGRITCSVGVRHMYWMSCTTHWNIVFFLPFHNHRRKSAHFPLTDPPLCSGTTRRDATRLDSPSDRMGERCFHFLPHNYRRTGRVGWVWLCV